jgi:hypothetical protein
MNLKNILIFLAGAEFFHTFVHVMLAYVNRFPIDMKLTVLTSSLNIWGIIINGLITIGLLWWASRLSKHENKHI